MMIATIKNNILYVSIDDKEPFIYFDLEKETIHPAKDLLDEFKKISFTEMKQK